MKSLQKYIKDRIAKSSKIKMFWFFLIIALRGMQVAGKPVKVAENLIGTH